MKYKLSHVQFIWDFSGTALRPHKLGLSHDRLSLFETATLNNTVLNSQDKLITPPGYGQAEYVGVSLPLEIIRLFEVWE